MDRGSLMQAESSWIRKIWLCYLSRDLDWAEAGFIQLPSHKLAWLNRAATAFSLPFVLDFKRSKMCSALPTSPLISEGKRLLNYRPPCIVLKNLLQPQQCVWEKESAGGGYGPICKAIWGFQGAPVWKVKPARVSCTGRTHNNEPKVLQTEAIVNESYSSTCDSYKILVSWNAFSQSVFLFLSQNSWGWP